ncbi:hypothetical protein Mapa_010866 [Marchantia paleacea]|nr:hypothetical protein Mapa_010866 [Marchantia paleacea]
MLAPFLNSLVALHSLRALAGDNVANFSSEELLDFHPRHAIGRHIQVQRVEHRGVVLKRFQKPRRPAFEERPVVAGFLLHHRHHLGLGAHDQAQHVLDSTLRVVKGAVELQQAVHGHHFLLLHMEHPQPDVLQFIDHGMELELEIQRLGELGQPVPGVLHILFTIPHASDSNMRWWASRTSGEALKKRRPLEPLLDIEIYDMDAVALLEGLEDDFVGREVGEFRVGANMVQNVEGGQTVLFREIEIVGKGLVDLRPEARAPSSQSLRVVSGYPLHGRSLGGRQLSQLREQGIHEAQAFGGHSLGASQQQIHELEPDLSMRLPRRGLTVRLLKRRRPLFGCGVLVPFLLALFLIGIAALMALGRSGRGRVERIRSSFLALCFQPGQRRLSGVDSKILDERIHPQLAILLREALTGIRRRIAPSRRILFDHR